MTLEVKQAVVKGAFQGTQGLTIRWLSEAPSGTCHIDEGIVGSRKETMGFPPSQRKNSSR